MITGILNINQISDSSYCPAPSSQTMHHARRDEGSSIRSVKSMY